MSNQREALRSIRTFPQLIRFLRDEMDWPVESEDFEELTFDYTPEELGIDTAIAAKIEKNGIKRLRPLSAKQPWGIFFVKFEPKRLPVVALRRILSRVVLRKRSSASSAERAAWQADDLLFISNYGEGDERQISFAHFCQNEREGDLPTLKVLGWDNLDTPLHLDDVAEKLTTNLAWPENQDDADTWRRKWRSAFKVGNREVIATSRDLSIRLADLACAIRDSIKTALAIETESGPLTRLMKAFKEVLVHDLDANRFADMYAQTIAYGLLSARIADPKSKTADDFAAHMRTNPFLKELMETFLHASGRHGKSGGPGIDFDELGVSEVVELLDNANMEAIVRDFGDRNPQDDPVIHFYELFLKEYDPKKRVERGVFYTPRPVVCYIVRTVDELLRTELGLIDGLADTTTWGEMAQRHKHLEIPRGVPPDQPFVQILDPATGTGTFLVEVIELIHQRLVGKWKALGHSEIKIGALWNEYVPRHLLPRLYGYELMMAPYAISHLKIGLKLYETGYRFGSDERAHVYLTDSLEPASDQKKQMTFAVLAPALAHEAQAVSAIKRGRRFSIVIGNPPYLREKERGAGEREDRIGGWVRFGDGATENPPLFDDFIKPLAKAGKGVHAKLAYELSVVYWRLTLWLVFERWPGPGIIGMISPRAYLSGPGHFGMRQFMRKTVEEVFITDLGGDNRGARKSENIFDIETGVAIGVCLKTTRPRNSGCNVRYIELTGSAETKLAALQEAVSPLNMPWENCARQSDAFLPSHTGPYTTWPKLTDLLPWQHSGSQFKRLWPISESHEVLQERWRRLLNLPPEKRAKAYIETRDRVVASSPFGIVSMRFTGIGSLKRGTRHPPIIRYCYRSLDRQWCFADERLADFIRPALMATLGPQQVFVATLMSKQLGVGPAISAMSCLPDMDVFCNRGAKDVIPLWRDAAAKQPNVTSGVLEILAGRMGVPITPEQFYCYCVAVLAGPTYTDRFEEELKIPGPRIPLTADAAIFMRGARLGALFIWLQTFGERWLLAEPKPQNSLSGSAVVSLPVSDESNHYPEDFIYDAALQKLQVGELVISNVKPEVYGYNVSCFKVVESWLRYRMKERGGRARRETTRSVLDEVRPRRWIFTQELLELLWVVEACIGMWPELAELLDAATIGPQILAGDLPLPGEGEKEAPREPTQELQGALI